MCSLRRAAFVGGLCILFGGTVAISQEVVRLDQLIEELKTQNPDLQSLRHRLVASEARIPQAGALPDPTLMFRPRGITTDHSPIEFDEADQFRIVAKQGFPFPGKRKLRAGVAAKASEMVNYRIFSLEDRLIQRLTSLYWQLYLVRKTEELLLQHQEILEEMVQSAQTRYAAGHGTQSDVLKAVVRRSEIELQLEIIVGDEATLLAKMNALLERPPGTPILALETPTLISLSQSLDALMEMARRSNPQLLEAKTQIDQSEFALRLARRERYPDMVAGIEFWDVREGLGNQDRWAASMMFNIPLWYRNKQAQGIREASEQKLAAEREIEAIDNALSSLVEEMLSSLRSAESEARFYREQIVPQTTLAFEASKMAYVTGQLDFLSFLTDEQALLDAELRYYAGLVAFRKAFAVMEEVTATRLADQSTSARTLSEGTDWSSRQFFKKLSTERSIP